MTCSRCIGTWAAGGLTVTQMLAPRFGRLLTWSLAAAGANDFLQAGFAALTNKSNELRARPAQPQTPFACAIAPADARTTCR